MLEDLVDLMLDLDEDVGADLLIAAFTYATALALALATSAALTP